MIIPPKHAETGIAREIWRHYNALRDFVQSLTPRPGRNVHINHTTAGTTYSADIEPGADGGTRIKPCKVKSILDNYLMCVDWEGTFEGTTQFKVARPWLQRRYVWETLPGVYPAYTWVSVQTRTVLDAVGGTTDTHEITQPYTAGDMILAANVKQVSDYGTWDWVDINFDGRDWARIATSA